MTMTMIATVLEVQNDSLLVLDCDTQQEVLVHTTKSSCFCPGHRVRIVYNGIMTASIPPQITATCITRLCGCGC